MSSALPYGAKTYLEVLDESLQYIDDRRKGRITSLKTPWSGVNNAGINGLEWNSMLTIAARPGSGKTMIVSQILRESYKMNPNLKINILDFQFEMGPKQYGSRAFAAETALDYNIVLSGKTQLDDYSYNMMIRYREECKRMYSQGIQRLYIGKPLGHESIYNAIHHFYNHLGGLPMIVTIDHSWLVKKDASEKEKIQTLYNTVEMLMRVKNELPIIIVMLSQLNRNIDEAARKLPGSIANYPTSNDIFGGDALMQGSDMLVVLNRPFKADIRSYGPQKFISASENIFMHLLKVRNGSDDTPILFFKAEFNRQRMIEIAPPIASAPGSTTDYIPRNPGGFTSRNVSAEIGSEL